MNHAEVVRIEGWERFRWMRAAFSVRRGGVSSSFGGKSLNLGWKADDEDENVRENRRRFLAVICGDVRGECARSLVTVRQVHSDVVRVIGRGEGPLETEGGRAVLEGDGMVTDVPGVMLGIQVADCVPVLVADTKLRVVGGFHAGWRGTLAGIVEKGVGRMRAEYGSRPEDIVAAVGPSIGSCCYWVGEEVPSGFEGGYAYGAELFLGEGGRGAGMRLDLWEANRRQLLEAGVPAEAVTVLGECTACSREESGERRFFSYRAERGVTGRMMGVIGVVGETVAGGSPD